MDTFDSVMLDLKDIEKARKLMDKYGAERPVFIGRNEADESVHVKIRKRAIMVETLQNNTWRREDWYYYDGSSEVIEGEPWLKP